MEGNLATRQSLVEDIADRTANPELSAFQSVGVVSDNVAGIVARLDFLPAVLPKQSIWEAELAYQDYGEAQVRQKRADLALDRVDHLLVWLGGPDLDDFAERQRIAMIAAVDRERLALTELVDAEQGQLSEMIARERASVLEAVRTERLAATADVRQAAAESIGNANVAAQQVIDHLVLRLAMLFAGSILLWGAVANLVRRRAPERGSPASWCPVARGSDLGLPKPEAESRGRRVA